VNRYTRNILIVIFTLIIIGYLAWFFKGILTYIIISSVFALILKPVKHQIEKIHIKQFKLPNWLNAIACLILWYLLLAGIIALIIPPIIGEVYAISQLDTKAVMENFEAHLKFVEQLLVDYQIAEDPRAMANEYIQEKITALLSITNIGSLFNYFIGFTGDFFIGFFSVSFITFFFLKDSGMGKEIVEASVPNYYVEQALHTLQKIEYLLSRYFTGLLFQIIGITLLAYVGLSLVGIKHALLIAFFAGVVNIIPYIGPLMGSGFAILVLISTNLDVSFTDVLLPMIFQIIGVFMVVQVADNIIFQPIIFSSSVKAHPLEIFIVILIAARLAGITGMIAAIPAYTFLRVVAKEFLDDFKIVQSLTSQL